MASRRSADSNKPLPTPQAAQGQAVIDTSQERQRLLEMFGSYGGPASSGSSQHNVELASPSPPTSADASTPSSGHLPEN
ncbi:hypothetical protein GGH20_004616, partial [Coemansia sp. RSA 1937]